MLRTPWQIQKSVVFALFIRELKTRFGAYKLSYVWMLVEPLAHIALLSYILSQFGSHLMTDVEFPVFLVTGLIPFFLFRDIALHVMDGVEANRALFSFKQVKPIDTFAARTVLESFLSSIVLAILLIGMGLLGLKIPLHDPFLFVALLACMALMALGLGMIFCVVAHYLNEARIVIRIAFLPLYFMSGVMFPLGMIPADVRVLLTWNPVLQGVELIRAAFFEHYRLAPGIDLSYLVIFTLVVLFLGLAWYRNRRFALLAS